MEVSMKKDFWYNYYNQTNGCGLDEITYLIKG